MNACHLSACRHPRATALVALAGAAMLAACSSEKPPADPMAQQDPAATEALNDQIMVDPDLSGENEANAALTGGTDASLPPPNATPEAIAAAREEAGNLLGGMSNIQPAPAAHAIDSKQPAPPALTAAARAAVSPGGADCASQVQYSAAWAAKLPAALPVYPRGATQEAAGTDKGDCALRVVTFHTPVSLDDVFAFYATSAAKAGYLVDHVKKDGDDILSGTKGNASYVVYGRKLENGMTEIDLVTSGK